METKGPDIIVRCAHALPDEVVDMFNEEFKTNDIWKHFRAVQEGKVYDLRFPRIFIAMIGGAAMAVSGVLLQAVMKNPLADPGIVGISSGASFTAVLITAFFPALYFFTLLFAFIGGVAACLLVYSLSWRGGLSPLRIILVGVAVNAMFTGLMSAFNSGTGSTYSGAASIVNANTTMKTWEIFRPLRYTPRWDLCFHCLCAQSAIFLLLRTRPHAPLGRT